MLKSKPYFLLLFASLLLLLRSFFQKEEAFVINVHDAYYVIAPNHLYWLLSLLFFFFFIIYFSLEKLSFQLFKGLNGIHIYGTLVFTFGILFPYNSIFDSTDFLIEDYSRLNFYIVISAFLFLFVQLLFIINIFVAIIKKLCNAAT